MPANGAVGIGHDDDAAVGRQIDAPSTPRAGLLRELPALRVESAQIPVRAKDEAGKVTTHGKRARYFILFECDRLSGKCWILVILPLADRQPRDQRLYYAHPWARHDSSNRCLGEIEANILMCFV